MLKTGVGGLSLSTNKCATLKHGGRFGGSLSPNPAKNIAPPQPQHLQLQQHHLQKPNNQQLELQTYQLHHQQQQQHHQQPQQYPSSTLPYKKPGTGFTETSSILKKHREEVHEMTMKPPQSSIFSIETSVVSQSHRQVNDGRSSKQISIINQPLPEIPKQHQQTIPEQVLCASNLNNYRSLQRPSGGGNSKSSRSAGRAILPPILPPKSRQPFNNRAQQPLPQKSHSIGYNQQLQQQSNQQQHPTRERSRGNGERSRQSYDDHQYRSSSKQQQQQQNFQTLPHHHHYPPSSSTASGNTKSNRKSDGHDAGRGLSYSSKSLQRGSREMSHHQPFENYSATEL